MRMKPLLGWGRHATRDGITIYPVERLGNQLFTWAAGLAQAQRLGAPYYVNEGFYRHLRPARQYGGHRYLLDSFDSGLESPDDPAAHVPVLLGLPAVPAAAALHRRAGPHYRSPVFIEDGFAYDPSVESVTAGTTMMGFFQSWKYLRGVEDEVRRRIARPSFVSDWFRELSDHLVPGDGSIVLNVRRGDYLLPEQQRMQGLARRAYYERALKLLRRAGLDGPVYVMSDSLQVAMDELEGLADLRPLAPSAEAHPLEGLLALSRADGLVAANSSFSWWGGFLRNAEDRLVVAPRPWFSQPVDTKDLLPPGWITLDRE